jgi:hypothetical protein
MRELISGIIKAQIAVASWSDEDSPDANEDGMCWMTIKGSEIAQRVLDSGRTEKVACFFFHCDNREQALNMRALYGDYRKRMN